MALYMEESKVDGDSPWPLFWDLLLVSRLPSTTTTRKGRYEH